MDAICADLAAEHESLDTILEAMTPEDWDRPSAAEGWLIRDQVTHLATVDIIGTVAATDAEQFRAEVRALASTGSGTDWSIEPGRTMEPAALFDWWRTVRAEMLDAFRQLDPKDRLPWFGPDMGARSFATARLMETWAHGQDIVDVVGGTRPPTDRLKHVAHIGVGARRFAYSVNKLDVPDGDVRVELAAPGGDTWTWGEFDGVNTITGPAEDFALLVTQRRHRDDLDLVVQGPAADEWVSIAQSFAGPPGGGRAPLAG